MGEINKNQEKNNILKIGSKNLNSENWKVYHPDGKHMFTCGEKKANWYLDRDLAEIIGNKEIRFKFYPNGNGFDDNEEFGRGIRKMMCVVSGINTGLQRHHIVPYCYRTYFPEQYKSKNHHDVVLINYRKHGEYEKMANEFKNVIGEIYGVKTINELNSEYTTILRQIGKENSILLNAIHSIFRSHNTMPTKIRLQKLKFIGEKIGMSFEEMIKLNYIQLYKLYLLLREKNNEEIDKFKTENRNLYDHGYYVVQKLDTEEKIEDFVKIWRNHFIETMNPEYMPYGWSIDFRIKTKL